MIKAPRPKTRVKTALNFASNRMSESYPLLGCARGAAEGEEVAVEDVYARGEFRDLDVKHDGTALGVRRGLGLAVTLAQHAPLSDFAAAGAGVGVVHPAEDGPRS